MKFPLIREVRLALEGIKEEYAKMPADIEGGSIDVRLQVWEDGDWSIHTGDPQYDQDHNGYWGYGAIDPSIKQSLWSEAKYLIDQVKNDYYQSL
jgi:hypothetical protein